MKTRVNIIFLLFIITKCSAKIPDYIQVCKANDKNVSSCILNSVNHLKDKLKEGIPELGVPPFEPLHLGDLQLKRGPETAQLDANITDMKNYGVANFQVLELKANIPKSKFKFRVLLPSVSFEGKYKMDMRILFVDIKGEGKITGNFTNYEFLATLKGNKILQNGEEYLKFEKMKLYIKFEKAYMHLDNLFNGDPALGKATNDLINEHSDLILNDIKPSLESSIADRCTEIANKITLSFKYSELFP